MCHSGPTNDAAALQEDASDLQKLVYSILDIALNIGDREFGCERCSTCLIEISEVLKEWLTKKPANCEEMLKKLDQFLYFPLAMKEIVEKCIYCADQKKVWIDSLATQLNILCSSVIKKCIISHDGFTPNNNLNLSRLAAIVEIFKEKLKDVLSKHKRWESVSSSIKNLESQAGQLESCLQHKNAHFLFEEEKILKDGSKIKRPKRVCGGGILDLYIGEHNQENRRTIYVVNFSPNYISGLVNAPVVHKKTDTCLGDFQPCQRELPFQIEAVTVKRKRGGHSDDYIEIEGEMLHHFSNRHCDAKYFQVFKIKKISRLYYYLSLCACLTPSSKRYRKSIVFLDRYDIPKSSPEIRIEEYYPSSPNLKSVLKI